MLATAPSPSRPLVHRTRGRTHGPITRLMSPGDLGEVVKPFVFLDLFDDGGRGFPGFGLHPHSGIATLTYVCQGEVRYEDTNGSTGLLGAGGVEWMQAGSGVWHGGGGGDSGRTRGFQLWIALPPHHELGPSVSLYQGAQDLPKAGPATVLLGARDGVASAIEAPSAMTYLAVTLKAGERWTYQPPAGHTVLWVALAEGAVTVPDSLQAGDMGVFARSDQAVAFVAQTDSQFVLGSAVPHDHDLVLGYYSVHTSAEALRDGEARIQDIRQALIAQGRL